MMSLSFKATLSRNPGEGFPSKWTPLIVHGVDTSGVNPLFLGFLYDSSRENILFIVTKMPGYSWYYNQYNGMQYSGVSVAIYRVHASMEFDDRFEFEVDLPWSEEFQQKKGVSK